MAEGPRTLKRLPEPYCVIFVAAMALIAIITLGLMTGIGFKEILGPAFDVVISLVCLYIIAHLSYRALTIGWSIYITGMIVDLIDEFITLPVWLDEYYEDAASGLGLLVIVLAFYFLVKEKQQQMEHFRVISNLDSLTGLYNHRFFYDYGHETLPLHDSLALLFCDLDYFKTVNDTYGHIAGDEVLKETAKIIRKSVGDRGLTFRYGGEEFAVLLADCASEEACIIAKRINKHITSSPGLQQYAATSPITISIGISSFPQNAGTVNDLVTTADQAMYLSKQRGRNRITLYSPETGSLY